MHRFIATITPQAWQRKYAVEVDAPGETEWDATDYVRKAMREHSWARKAVRSALNDQHGDHDWICDDPNAPAWVRAWEGPFDMELRIDQVPRVDVLARKRAAPDERGLTPDQLRELHGGNWGEHPEHPVEHWQAQVASDDTRRGYWEWVAAEIEAA